MRWLKQLLKRIFHRRSKQGAKLKEVYTDTRGRRHYTFINPLDAPMSRAVAAEAAIRVAEWGLSKERLKELVALGKESLQKGDAVTNAAAWYEIEVGLEAVAEEEGMLEVAAVLTIEEDEPLEYDPLIAHAKVERWRMSPVDRDFFLLAAWPCLRQFETWSDIDILSYLKQAMPLSRRMPHAMRQFKDSLRKSTSQRSNLQVEGSRISN